MTSAAASGDIQLSGATRSMPVTDHSVRSLLAPDRRTTTINNSSSAINGSHAFDGDVFISKRSATESRQNFGDSDDDHMTGPPCKRLCSGFRPSGDVFDHSISSPGSTCRPPFVGVPSLHAYWPPRHLEDATSESPFVDSDHQLTTPGRSTWSTSSSSSSECQKPLTSPSSATASGLRPMTDPVQQPRPTSASSSKNHRGEQPVNSDVDCNKSSDRYEPCVELESDELWRRFYSLCTEMVITKSGRSYINLTVLCCTLTSSYMFAWCLSYLR